MKVSFITLNVVFFILSQSVHAKDSDGDGISDSIDPNPLVADFNIRWEVTCVSTRWSVSSVAGRTETRSITESSTKSHSGGKTWDATTEVNGSIDAEVKGKVVVHK